MTSKWRPPPRAAPSLLILAEKAKSSAVLLKDEEAPGGEKLRVDGSISWEEETAVDSDGSDMNIKKGKGGGVKDSDNTLVRNTAVFTWKNLTCTVDKPTGERKLLDKCCRAGLSPAC